MPISLSEPIGDTLIRTMFDNGPIACVITDADQLIERVNRAFSDMLGYTEAEIAGTNIEDLITPADREAGQRQMRNARSGFQHDDHLQLRYFHKDGRIVHAITTTSAALVAGRTVMISQLADLTERRQGAAALQAAHERLQTAIEGADVGVWDVDLLTRKMHWDATVRAHYGLAADQPVPDLSSWLQLLHAEDRQPVQAKIDAGLQPDSTGFDAEFRVPQADGSLRWLRAFGRIHHGADGAALLARGISLDITDAKRLLADKEEAQTALAKRERRFRAMAENATDIVVLTDAQGLITYAGPSITAIAGYQPEELIGHSMLEFVDPAGSASLSRKYAEILRTPGRTDRTERSYRHKNGELRVFESVSHNLLHDPDIAGIVVNLRDITERKTAEAGLRLATLLIEQSASVLFRWAVKPGWPVVYVSQNVQQWGYPAADFLAGRPQYISLIHPDDRQRIIDEVQAHLADGASHFAQVYRVLKPSGAVIWVDDRTTVERDAAGHPLFLQGVVTDVSDRMVAEQAMRDNEQTLRAITDAAMDAVILMDPDGKIAFWNPAAERQLGYSREEALGQDMHNLLAPERYREAFRQSFVRFCSSGQGTVIGKVIELSALRKDGVEVPVELSVSAVQMNGRQNAVGILRDISQRKRQEEQSQAEFRRAEAQLAAISQVTASEALAAGAIETLAAQITEAAAQATGAARVNVWLFNEDESELRCVDLYEAGPGRHSSGLVLRESEYRNEFQALKTARYVAADDPLSDPRTAGYVDSYLKPLGIRSMLDAVIESSGRHLGLLCIEHVGQAHHWEADEISFASQLADKLGLCIANHARHQLTRELQEAQRVAHLGNWLLQPATGQVTWSEEIYRIFGMEPASSPPDYAHQAALLTPASHAGLQAAVTACQHSGEPFELDLEILHRAGAHRWIAMKGEPLRDAAGVVVALRGTAQDITEQRRQELALRRSTRALKALSRGNGALAHAQTEQDLYGEMCRIIVEAGGYRMAWAGLAEAGAAQRVRIVGTAGDSSGYLDHADISYGAGENGAGPAGECIRSGQVQLCRDIAGDPRMAPWREAAFKAGFVAVVSLPLLTAAGGTFGVLSIYSDDADAFDPDELALLTELADALAYGVSNLRVAVERRSGQEKLLQNFEAAVGAIGATMEARDPYTAGHQHRVADLGAAIAAEMGLPEKTVKGIHFGGLIHDIGKIQVPSEILSKPGRLSKAEFELIKVHPQAGYDIIKGIDFPWPVADIVLQHHERIDGSGYPQGLKGEQISVEARVLAVADVLEAMASHRPYRPAMGIEPALAELQRGRGSSYDPAAVDACVTLFRERGYRMSE